MRTFALPLHAMARGFGRLAAGDLGPEGDRVAAAMGSNPELVGYAGTIDTELMAGEDGLVAKVGAEGLLCIGLPDGRGVAIEGARRRAPAGAARRGVARARGARPAGGLARACEPGRPAGPELPR